MLKNAKYTVHCKSSVVNCRNFKKIGHVQKQNSFGQQNTLIMIAWEQKCFGFVEILTKYVSKQKLLLTGVIE